MRDISRPIINEEGEVRELLEKGVKRLVRAIISTDSAPEKFEGFFEGYLEEGKRLLISHIHPSFFELTPSSGSVNFIFDTIPYFFRFLKYEREAAAGKNCISLETPPSIHIAQNREFSRFEYPLKEPIQVVMFNPYIKRRIIRNLIDISYLGISFKGVEDDTRISNGTNIGNVIIFTDEIEALTTNCRLLHKEKIVTGTGETYYKIGMSFLPIELDSSSTLYSYTEEVIRDQEFITDCIFSLIKGSSELHLKSRAYFAMREISLPAVVTEWNREMSEITIVPRKGSFPPSMEDYDRFEFSAFGGYFWGRVAIKNLSERRLTLQIPGELYCHRHRWGGRLPIHEKEKGTIRFKHPLFGSLRTHEIFDISTKGLSFIFDKYLELYMEGLFICDIDIEIGDLKIKVDLAQIISYSEAEAGAKGVDKASIKFISISDRDFNELFIYILKSFYPNISFFHGSGDEIWRIYESFNFIHERKRAILEKDIQLFRDILKTMDVIHSPDIDFYKNFIVTENGEVMSSGTMIQAYENSWILQHLISDPKKRSRMLPGSIFYSMVDYMINHPEIKYIKVYFRPENKFPRRLFADFSTKHPGSDVNILEKYEYYKLYMNDFIEPVPDWADEYISSANMEDILTIQNYFIKNGLSLIAKSDDFIEERYKLDKLHEMYSRAGLYRDREILVAKKKGEIVAFSSLEDSSPGLNLSLILSAFRIFEVKRWVEDYEKIFRALVLKSVEHYRSRGAVWGIGMIYDSESAKVMNELGFIKDRTYLCWTLHRQLLRSYYYFILYILGRYRIILTG